MKKGKRIIAVLLYLVIVTLLFGLRLRDLFDWRQLLLVLAGGVILYLPAMEKEDFRRGKRKAPDYGLFARNTIYASYIQTFVLLFLLLYRGMGAEQMDIGLDVAEGMQPVGAVSGVFLRNIALGFRPLLYGICIWVALGSEGGEQSGRAGKKGEEGRMADAGAAERVWTAEECYRRFLELGLTRREAEVAVQVCRGVGNKEIAMELCISETTVKKHVSNIFDKLGVRKREEIARIVFSRDFHDF